MSNQEMIAKMAEESPEIVEALLAHWERDRLGKLTRKVINRLTRIRASGIFSGYTYRSIWGEYSHHVQTGGYDTVSDLLDDLLHDECVAVVEGIPEHELLFFTALMAARGIEDEDGEASSFLYLLETLKDAISSEASARDLERYSEDQVL